MPAERWVACGGTAVSVHPLRTADGAGVNGFLFSPGPSDTVICIMHPREFLATHDVIPQILAAGRAVFTQTSRSVGSDLRLEHEAALLNVAAGAPAADPSRLADTSLSFAERL